jgi:opacity protein-like surface antigen
MKVPSLKAFAFASILLLAVSAQAATVQQILSDAQAAYLRGDMKTAQAQFETVRQLDPKNATAIGYLKLIRAANANAPKGSAIQAQLANVMIEKVSVREATLGSVLEFVRQTVAKSSGNKVQINFVAMLPQERMDKQTVTLNLSNIPASEVLRYIGEQANVDFEFDKYAIKVKPASAQAAAQVQLPAAQ